MREALFVRTQDLQDLIERVRARELTPTLLLESQMAARMASVLLADRGEDGSVLAGTARELVPLLTGADEAGQILGPLWDALDELRTSDGGQVRDKATGRRVARALQGWRGSVDAKERKRLIRWMGNSFADLHDRDPASHACLARLLHGDTAAVLTPSESSEAEEQLSSREEARELLRWRGILTDMLPPDHRPQRRVVVPGGVGCTDFEGPRLSWQAIAGVFHQGERGCFEAHLLSCDLCFEFHYRGRWSLEILRQEKRRILGRAAGDTEREDAEGAPFWKRVLGRLRGS